MTLRQKGLRGIWTAFLSFVVLYVVYLGVSAVTILVAALDSKGSVDPLYAARLGWLFMMLAQGTGVTFSGILIGIPALLLTVFSLAVIASLVRRRDPSIVGFVAHIVTWIIFSLIATSMCGLTLSDNLGQVGVKTAVVAAVGYVLGALPAMAKVVNRMVNRVASHNARLVMREAFVITRGILIAFAIESVVVVLLWFMLNHDAMSKVFSMTEMPAGSRVMTTILSLFWFPNLCLWALSWLFGAGFAMGSLGTFTLWSGSAHDLPPVPIFGIFPQAITGDGARFTLLLIPLITGCVIALIELLRIRGFNYFNVSVSSKLAVGIRAVARHIPFLRKHLDDGLLDDPNDGGTLVGGLIVKEEDGAEVDSNQPMTAQRFLHLFIVKAAYPIMTFCISGVLLVFSCAIAFTCSNGALGTGNLAHIGVSVSESTQAAARPAFSGMLLAWVIALVALCIVNFVEYRRRKAAPTAALSDDDLVPLDEIKKRDNKDAVSVTPHPRSVHS
ncbi:MAG: DUF6350 family protein [Bifidobacteriaceae bacterium]|jgi:hypothetical protein|nr:DUF6350 family protein [Bifidobacteriaceae bacterium]